MYPSWSEVSWDESLGRHLALGMSLFLVHIPLLSLVACGPIHCALFKGNEGTFSQPQVRSGTGILPTGSLG